MAVSIVECHSDKPAKSGQSLGTNTDATSDPDQSRP